MLARSCNRCARRRCLRRSTVSSVDDGGLGGLQRLEIWTGKSHAPERSGSGILFGILLRLWSLLLRRQGLARACSMLSRACVRAWTGRDRDVPPNSAQRAYTLVCGCVGELRCVSESVCIWGLGGVSGGATVISLGIRSSLGFRIRFRFRVGLRCRMPHDTHGSVTYIYTLV